MKNPYKFSGSNGNAPVKNILIWVYAIGLVAMAVLLFSYFVPLIALVSASLDIYKDPIVLLKLSFYFLTQNGPLAYTGIGILLAAVFLFGVHRNRQNKQKWIFLVVFSCLPLLTTITIVALSYAIS